MGKKLSEMTLGELWQLFPIYLTEHQAFWKQWYCEEEAFLKSILPLAKRISHIGSTAVDSIWAKPIVDILVEVRDSNNLYECKEILIDNGYICMSQGENRFSFNKGYTENGYAERVFHLHLRRAGDNNELYFRDYLIEFLNVAKEYEKLKFSLWKEFENDRDAYTNAKTEFVREYTEKAKLLYADRY